MSTLRLLFLSAGLSAASLIGADSGEITLDDLYIVFLSMQSEDAQQTGGERNVATQAARLGVDPADVAKIHGAAAQFKGRDTALTQEARLHYATSASGSKAAAAVSFALRRQTLARAAFSELEGSLSPDSYAALQDYLENVLRQELVVIPIRH